MVKHIAANGAQLSNTNEFDLYFKIKVAVETAKKVPYSKAISK